MRCDTYQATWRTTPAASPTASPKSLRFSTPPCRPIGRSGPPVTIVTVIGNRPQFVKAAAVSAKLREHHEELIVHTGQHYDDELSRVFFEELGVPAPDHQLLAASGTNTAQTARILAELEPILADVRPELVLIYGDTNSTLAGAAGRRPGRHTGRPCGGGHALLRPLDARGAEPRAGRPRQRPAALLHGNRRAEPGARGRGRGGAPGGRRDGGRVAGVPGGRP